MKNNTVFEKTKSFLEKQKRDYASKTMTSSLLSFSITVLFALYNGILGIRRLSVWHGSICVFYLLLVAIRGMILLKEKKVRTKGENERVYHRQRIFIISSVILMVLNLSLILPIALMVMLKKPINMGLIPSITMATYTTYKITMASIHIRKQKRSNHRNVLVTELRTINFIDALVSVLTLQNTLIMVMQNEAETNDMLVLSAVSSAVIYIAILFTTVHMLVKGFKATPYNSRRKP